MPNYWLMKAEPDSRIVKGKDVKFSVDDFEASRTTAWEGVRNHEAKNIMKNDMRVGDQVFFYHSNCKNPGIAALAEVSKEAFPDYTAHDPSHPYYDPKASSKPAGSEPTWWMVELKFKSRMTHFVSLSFLRSVGAASALDDLAQLSADEGGQNLRDSLTTEDHEAIKKMPLLNRGRLSVQPVNEGAWFAIKKLAEKGGWVDQPKAKGAKPTVRTGKSAGRTKSTKPTKRKATGDQVSSEAVTKAETSPNEELPSSVVRRSKRQKK